MGPTASGKSGLAIKLAQRFGGEVVSGDAFQIYHDMSVGTAKPTPGEMQGIPHHLIDELPATAPYSLGRYLEDAKTAIKGIHSRGRLPILCGGTGLYISSLIDGMVLGKAGCSQELRDSLYALAIKEGNEALHRRLLEVDPELAAKLHPNNTGRIIRALEVYETTGITQSEHHMRSKPNAPPYTLCIIGLTAGERTYLYNRIDQRVDEMMRLGLLDEARRLQQIGWSKQASQAIGYKELLPFLAGERSLESCVADVKQATRRYAKRQLTWLRRDKRICWIYIDQLKGSDIEAAALECIVQNKEFLETVKDIVRWCEGVEQVD